MLLNPYRFSRGLGVTKVRKTSTQTETGAASWRNISWDVEDYDNLGAVDLGTSAVNIVVPANITLMRAQFKTAWSNSTQNRYLQLYSSGRTFMGDIKFAAANEGITTICSGWVAVTAGTTLNMQFNNNGLSYTIGNSTFGYPELTIEWARSFASLHA